MMLKRLFLTAASVLVAGCASDGTTAGTNGRLTTRLVAVAEIPPIQRFDASSFTFNVVVTSNLQEPVSGGVCAQTVEAKPISGGSWTNVTSSSQVCILIAAILAPGGTLTISASADRAKVTALMNGGGNTVLMRVRHSLVGETSNQNFTVQSNEITVTMN